MRLTRRQWLMLALSSGGVALLARFALDDRPMMGLRCLSAGEYQTVAALAAALFPAGGAFADSAADVDLARMFDGFVADEPEWNRTDLRRAIRLLELGPLIVDHRLARFSSLTPSEALACFEGWATSPRLVLRQVALGLRRFMNMVFYDRPQVWPAIGYPGPMEILE